ncbi:redoxin family protein [Spirosoma aerophilum]
MRGKEILNRPLYGFVLLVVLCLLPVRLQAQLTSTISGFFPKSWEGKQVMVVAKPLAGPPVIDTSNIVNRSATFFIKLGEPSPAYLWVEGNQDDVHFFIDSPRINIGLDPETVGQPLITGSASSEQWAARTTLLSNNRESRPDFSLETFTALQAGDSLAAFRLDQMPDSLRTADDNQLIRFIESYPLLPSSWYLFASNYFPYAKKVQLFEKLAAFSAYPSYQKLKEKLAAKQLGNKAPDFSLHSHLDSIVTLSGLGGNYLLIDFTVSHLVPYQQQHVDLMKLYQKYHSLGLEIITVSYEFNKKTDSEFLTRYNVPWTQVTDSMGPSSTMEAFGVDQLPTTVLLDKNKIIIDRELSIHELEVKLDKLLKK